MIINDTTFDERFTKTYDKLFGMFKSIAFRKYKNAVIAEDLAQNAFVESYGNLRKDSTEANMRTYITQVFRNSLCVPYGTLEFKHSKCISLFDTDEDSGDTVQYDIPDDNAIRPFELIEFESVLADLTDKITHPIAKEIVNNIVDISNLPAEVASYSVRKTLHAIERHLNLPYHSSYWYIKRYVLPCIKGYEFKEEVAQ